MENHVVELQCVLEMRENFVSKIHAWQEWKKIQLMSLENNDD